MADFARLAVAAGPALDAQGLDFLTVYAGNRAASDEATVEGSRITKVVYRQHYDSKHDLCLVINFTISRVITVWLNEKSDHHRTLDRSRYAEA